MIGKSYKMEISYEMRKFNSMIPFTSKKKTPKNSKVPTQKI